MQKTDKYYIWQKGVEMDINNHFNTAELECKCSYSDCKEQRISTDLIGRLTDVRAKLDTAIYITSGYRCRKHQLYLAASGLQTAKGISQHELGNAADINSPNMLKLGRLLEDEFNAIGTAKNFIHVDTRDDKERKWTYK